MPYLDFGSPKELRNKVAEREKWFLGSKSSSHPGFLSLTKFTLLASRSRKESNFARGIGGGTKLQDAARGKRTNVHNR